MPVDVIAGDSPLIIAFAHASTEIMRPVLKRLNATGCQLTDTDWHIDRLFGGLVENATTVRANFHRYVCNANGDPEQVGPQAVSSPAAMVPLRNLDGQPIWNEPPDMSEMARWRSAFHAPYHAALAAQIARLRAHHGFVVLLDCHAARPQRPFLFEGETPDVNIRTHMGTACDQKLAFHIAALCMRESSYKTVINKGGQDSWTVQRYGNPKRGVHALQISIALSRYLTEEADPWLYDPDKAAPLRHVLKDVLSYLQTWQPEPITAKH